MDTIDQGPQQFIAFVKRVGRGYPFNRRPAHGGIQIQENLRVLINRMQYLQKQAPHKNNKKIIQRLRECIFYLEERAAERHGLDLEFFDEIGEIYDIDARVSIEDHEPCRECGHLVCRHVKPRPPLWIRTIKGWFHSGEITGGENES